MVDQRDEPSPGLKVRKELRLEPEAVWVREFLSIGGTENITRFCLEDLHGLSLTRVVEALVGGDLLWAEKCDDVGSLCKFAHSSEDGVIEVLVWISAGEAKLEIRKAKCVEESDREPNAA